MAARPSTIHAIWRMVSGVSRCAPSVLLVRWITTRLARQSGTGEQKRPSRAWSVLGFPGSSGFCFRLGSLGYFARLALKDVLDHLERHGAGCTAPMAAVLDQDHHRDIEPAAAGVEVVPARREIADEPGVRGIRLPSRTAATPLSVARRGSARPGTAA